MEVNESSFHGALLMQDHALLVRGAASLAITYLGLGVQNDFCIQLYGKHNFQYQLPRLC